MKDGCGGGSDEAEDFCSFHGGSAERCLSFRGLHFQPHSWDFFVCQCALQTDQSVLLLCVMCTSAVRLHILSQCYERQPSRALSVGSGSDHSYLWVTRVTGRAVLCCCRGGPAECSAWVCQSLCLKRAEAHLPPERHPQACGGGVALACRTGER